MPCSLSVIIPARPGEPGLDALVAALEDAPAVDEVLVCSEGSRARSLNAGAAQARGELLWFLHADSRLAPDTVTHLLTAAGRHPDALLFFDLAFLDDASPFVRLNQWGGNLRARLLRLPFGDQGLACRRAVFARIRPYREDVPYGEDHLLVWQAHRARVPVRPVGAPLATSARTYAAHGWLRLTLSYQYRWLRQAAPEAWRLLVERLR
ncbi:MAG: glycosyltransferase [Rhodothalassiaceae bacterium]